MDKRLAVAAVAGLLLVTAAGCGDDDDSPTRTPAEHADVTIYFQEVEFNGVYYTCLLAGYTDAPALWCERDEDGDIE